MNIKRINKILGVFIILLIVGVRGWLLVNQTNHEKMDKAQVCYEKGEHFWGLKDFKDAMRNYEMVNEFYNEPHTKWVDLAQEKEWVCRAHLGDWTSSKGPADADVRKTRSLEYEKYKQEIAQITPYLCHHISRKAK